MLHCAPIKNRYGLGIAFVEVLQLLFIFVPKVYLYWRDAKPIKIKYAFFLTNSSVATLHICGRTGKLNKYPVYQGTDFEFKSEA